MARAHFDENAERPAPQNVPPVRARQGVLGVPVLIVLVVGLILAAIAWWGAELFGEAITPPPSEQVGNPANVQPAPAGGPAPATQP